MSQDPVATKDAGMSMDEEASMHLELRPHKILKAKVTKNFVIDLATLPPLLAIALADLDSDGDGKISLNELQKTGAYVKKTKSKIRWLAAITLVVFSLCVVLGGTFGMVYAIVELSKDTTIDKDRFRFGAFATSELDPTQWGKMETVTLTNDGMQLVLPVTGHVRLPVTVLEKAASTNRTLGPLMLMTNFGNVMMSGDSFIMDPQLKSYMYQVMGTAQSMVLDVHGSESMVNGMFESPSGVFRRRRLMGEPLPSCGPDDPVPCSVANVAVTQHSCIAGDACSRTPDNVPISPY